MYRMLNLQSGNDGYMMDGKRVECTWLKEVFISRWPANPVNMLHTWLK